ncbi:MAG: hypothetical protein H6617_04290 [Bdellovibrionaceae bacterium]|nr:hypothetical protein [Bdellovibrionales bacterium]MCB9253879.1 hypothetical protein [Pseudobdellovibrionaceae bacterium]
MLRLLMCLSLVALAYDPTELPKAYTEGIGAFEAPTENIDITAGALEEPPPAPVVPPEPSAVERLMTADTPEPELQSEVLKSILDDDTVTKGREEEWQTHKKFLELEEKEQRREERRERRRKNRQR